MPRSVDSGRVDLALHFQRLQTNLSATLDLASLIEHGTSSGATAEQHWAAFLNTHLPAQLHAAPAFVYDASGRRSRQIDIAIYDNLRAPSLYPNTAALHLPADAALAIFEVKPTFSRQWLRDASAKAASVRSLLRSPNAPLLTGLLAKSSVWKPARFAKNLRPALTRTHLDLGCSLDHGSFSKSPTLTISPANSSLHFFMYSLLVRLSNPYANYFRPPEFK